MLIGLRMPEALFFEKWDKLQDEETPIAEYTFTLMNWLKKCQELAVERVEDSRDKRKVWSEERGREQFQTRRSGTSNGRLEA